MLFSWLVFIMTFKSFSTLFTRFVISVALGKGVITSGGVVLAAENVTQTNNSTSVILQSQSSRSPILLTGTFTYGHSSNFEPYLKELGVPYLLRSLAQLASPTVTISKFCPSSDESKS
ncbi:Fatty acid-binding protein, partial [Caligus rogercresseyi]